LFSDLEKINKIASALKVKLKPQDLKSKDPSGLLFSIFTQWLPLASCVFRAVVDILPNPAQGQAIRLPRVLGLAEDDSKPEQEVSAVERSLLDGGQAENAPTIAFISKMFAVPTVDLPQHQRKQLSAEEMRQRGREAREAIAQPQNDDSIGLDGAQVPQPSKEQEQQLEGDSMVAFSRLYSGTLRIGQTLYCVFPKYDASKSPTDPANQHHISIATVSHLYLLMGRDLVAVESVVAGQVFGIGGLDEVVMRSATLCAPTSSDLTPSLDRVTSDAACLANLARLVFTVRLTVFEICRLIHLIEPSYIEDGAGSEGAR
jgi:ribosome assembly protein 1